MSNVWFLYTIVLFLWSSTWLAIKFQVLAGVPPLWSVAYRFGIAAIIFFAWAWVKRFKLTYSWHQHGWFLLNGIVFFSFSYTFFYWASLHLISGITAVISASIQIMNTFNSKFFLSKKPLWSNLVAGFIGLCGLIVLFWGEIWQAFHTKQNLLAILMGFGICLAGTFFASLGNIISTHINQQQKVPMLSLIAYSMFYGALFTAVLGLILHQSIIFPFQLSYLLSLGYLTIFGTVLGFSCYMKLLFSIGPSRASYVFIFIPVFALMISTVFEGYDWHLNGIIGITLILLGNFLIIKPPRENGRLDNILKFNFKTQYNS